ncbi:MAG: PIG-L family deacetylase [Clostridia bacterium]|nr:PIG-L family deacetylase [Clostridia bacterium]
MKRAGIGILLMILLLLSHPACADTAKDMAKNCRFASNAGGKTARLTDNNYSGAFRTGAKVGASLQVTLPAGASCQGISIHWGEMSADYEVQVAIGDTWETVHRGVVLYVNEYIALGGTNRFRIRTVGDTKEILSIMQLKVYGQGTLPDDVQQWEPPPEKADIMLVAAHPDDEFIFMGGTIPYYAVERGYDVVVVYMTGANRLRLHEMLAGLWAVGYRHYPVMLGFRDRFCRGLEEGLYYWNEQAVVDSLANLYRQYRPSCVVTHDLNGEYNHGNHCATAHGAVAALKRAGDVSFMSDYPPYVPLKLYLHLYEQNPIYMDWSQPLTAFGGRSAIDIAALGFSKHVSQSRSYTSFQGRRFYFEVVLGGPLDNGAFGLYHSEVGPDRLKNDFMENIYE